MILWLRVRRFGLLIGVMLALGLLLLLAGDRRVLLPTVVGGGASAVLWASFMPLAWAASLSLAFEGRGEQAEARPGPRLPILDAALLSGSTSAVIGLIVVLAPAGDVVIQLSSHLLILTGLAIVVTLLVHAAAGIMAATSLLIITSSYSPYLSGAQYVRIVQPDGNLVLSLVMATAAFACALVLMAIRIDLRVFGAD